jgi:Tol biopolymer transport system component
LITDGWEKLPDFPYNSQDYNVGHGVLHPNEKVLFFTSDMPGGLAGLDIFSVKLEGGYKAIAAPQNAGAPLNSRRNDFGVLIYDHDCRGYFSSDRRGNDDIYRFSPVNSAR